MGDKGNRGGGYYTNKEIAAFRAKTHAQWLNGLRNGRKRYSRSR